jgi:hypothetical protein
MRPLVPPRLPQLLALEALLIASTGCMSLSSEAPMTVAEKDALGGASERKSKTNADTGNVGRNHAAKPQPAPKPSAAPRPSGPRKPGRGGGGAKQQAEMADSFRLTLGAAPTDGLFEEEPEAERDGKANNAAPEVTRSWFPQTFLWQPLVETGPQGTTTVDLRVPDQLTTWRILALAHDRAGHQAGSVHTFDSTLPVYLDPVVPGWMYRGDTFQIPLMVQNNSADAVSSTLTASADGAATGTANSPVALEPWRSQIVPMTVVADAAGEAKVKARLQGFDAIERAVRVLPVGRPLERVRGGVLSGPRDLTIAGPEGTDPATERLDVLVFAGPLSVLQAEIERLGGGTAWDGPYGLALAGQVASVAARTGATVDDKAIRRLELQSWQRFLRSARAPDAAQAADLLAGLAQPTRFVESKPTRNRLVGVVVQNQRGDGTWSRSSSSTLQQVLVETAWSVRALPEDQAGARLRAAGAFERNLAQVRDPYTAAVLLSTGLIPAEQAKDLQKLVLDNISEQSDGTRSLGAASSEVRNAWGLYPSRAEQIGFATLALLGRDDLPWRGDLVSELLSSYSADWGFGAGAADPLVVEAVAKALPGQSEPVEVILSIDGVEVDRVMVDPTQPKVPALLQASTRGKPVQVGLKTASPVAGLAFVTTLHSWVPWKGDEKLPGVDVRVSADPFKVGQESQLRFSIAAPSGVSVTLEQGLPSGASVDPDALQGLAGLASSDVRTDRLRLTSTPSGPGQIIEWSIPVQPAFQGSFQTIPLTLTAGGREVTLPPLVWTVGS